MLQYRHPKLRNFETRSSRLRRKSWCSFPACGSLKRQCEDHNQDLEVTITNFSKPPLGKCKQKEFSWWILPLFAVYWSCHAYIQREPHTGCWATSPTIPGSSFYREIWGGRKKAKDYSASHTQGDSVIHCEVRCFLKTSKGSSGLSVGALIIINRSYYWVGEVDLLRSFYSQLAPDAAKGRRFPISLFLLNAGVW